MVLSNNQNENSTAVAVEFIILSLGIKYISCEKLTIPEKKLIGLVNCSQQIPGHIYKKTTVYIIIYIYIYIYMYINCKNGSPLPIPS